MDFFWFDGFLCVGIILLRFFWKVIIGVVGSVFFFGFVVLVFEVGEKFRYCLEVLIW